MSNGHTHIDSHPCAAVIGAGTLARVIAIQIHLGLGIKGIAVFCLQRYACDIEFAFYCSRLRNVFPSRSDGAVDTGVGAGEREVTSRFIPFLQFGDIQFHAVDGCTGVYLLCGVYHQLDDMLVGGRTEVSAALFQIEPEIIGITAGQRTLFNF